MHTPVMRSAGVSGHVGLLLTIVGFITAPALGDPSSPAAAHTGPGLSS